MRIQREWQRQEPNAISAVGQNEEAMEGCVTIWEGCVTIWGRLCDRLEEFPVVIGTVESAALKGKVLENTASQVWIEVRALHGANRWKSEQRSNCHWRYI